jgi:hypothetical protein
MGGMTLTHHPARLFRLSCGCLRTFPVMPAGPEHVVLCVSCALAVTTVLAYPEGYCDVQGWATLGKRTRVSCTLGPRHEGVHFDEFAATSFTGSGPRLVRMREGKTGRA